MTSVVEKVAASFKWVESLCFKFIAQGEVGDVRDQRSKRPGNWTRFLAIVISRFPGRTRMPQKPPSFGGRKTNAFKHLNCDLLDKNG